MNRRFLWWGISPLGFIVASTWDIGNYVWSSVLLGWLIAALARRWECHLRPHGPPRIRRRLRDEGMTDR